MPSSTSFTVDVAPFPSGRAVTGSVAIDDVASPVPTGAVWTGADYDAVTGEIGSGSYASPVGPITIPNAFFGGNVIAQQRLVQVGEVSGRVLPDGTVEMDPVQFRVDTRSASIIGELDRCVSEPFTVGFEGTADASGLHLTATDITLGPVPTGSCAGNAVTINGALSGRSVDLDLHVAGDFTPPEAVDTEVSVFSWFDEVDQFNQTVLSAQVTSESPVTSGTVEFRDGDHILATAPVSNGSANAVVALPDAGTRTVTASYSGSGVLAAATADTSVVVTPAPTGFTLAGGMSINGFEVAPGAAGVFSGPVGEGGTITWQPVIVTGDVDGNGPSSAEVRVLPVSPLSANGPGMQAQFVVHIRSITTNGTTITPLGCLNLIAVDLTSDGGNGADVDGTSTPLGYGGCTQPLATAWTNALTGTVTGHLTAG